MRDSGWEAQQCTRRDPSMSSILPGEPLFTQFTQHRDGWRAAQWCCWASAPNIDVILLISTLSLLLISLISAWSAAKQQQTELFLSPTISSHWLPHTLRETGRILFFQNPPAPSIHGLSIRAALIPRRFWSLEVHNHTEWVEAFDPWWLNCFLRQSDH